MSIAAPMPAHIAMLVELPYKLKRCCGTDSSRNFEQAIPSTLDENPNMNFPIKIVGTESTKVDNKLKILIELKIKIVFLLPIEMSMPTTRDPKACPNTVRNAKSEL